MLIHDLFEGILNEVIWEYRYAAADAVRKYPNDWIHFTDVPKLGVNPSKQHKDPPGIYFYPTKWLLSDDASLSQYATEMKYYYVARIKKPNKILNLGRVTEDQVRVIAQRNGWLEDLERIRANPAILNNAHQPMEKRLLRKAGGFFYACLDYLANKENKSWLAMLRGIDGLYDPNHGIISRGEISQLVVFNKSLINVLEFGENTDNHDRVYADLLKRICDEYGGKFEWRHKKPRAEMVIDGKPVITTLDMGWYRLFTQYIKDGFWISATEKLDTHLGDVESAYRDMRYFIRKAAEQAGTQAYDLYWDGNRIEKLFKMLRPNTYQIFCRVEDGVANYWLPLDSRVITPELRAKVDKSDQLVVEAGVHMKEWAGETQQVLKPGTDLRAAASKILDAMAIDLERANKEHNEGRADLTGIGKISGFAFGDRLGSLADYEARQAARGG